MNEIEELQTEIARLDCEVADYRAELKHANAKIAQLEGDVMKEKNQSQTQLQLMTKELMCERELLTEARTNLAARTLEYTKVCDILEALRRASKDKSLVDDSPSYGDLTRVKQRLLEAIDEIF